MPNKGRYSVKEYLNEFAKRRNAQPHVPAPLGNVNVVKQGNVNVVQQGNVNHAVIYFS